MIIQDSQVLPLIPLRALVIFPKTEGRFIIGRPSSLRALKISLEKHNRTIFLSMQRDAMKDNPEVKDISHIGVIARILQHVESDRHNIKVLVEAMVRGEIQSFTKTFPYFEVLVEKRDQHIPLTPEIEAFMQNILERCQLLQKLSTHHQILETLERAPRGDISAFTDIIASALRLSIHEQQKLLETLNPLSRLQHLSDLLDIEIEKVKIDQRISQRVRKQMEKAQKEYYLNEKIKAIHEELGLKEDFRNEILELKEKIEKVGMPKAVKEKALQELKRLEAMTPMSAEATVSRTYLDWLIAVPWKKASRERHDINYAQKILDEDHYGLEKVKERILEFLAVRQLKRKAQGTILCFVGPPGVGKSSLAKSIARATGRKFVRLSLGGVRDEAEIRGHRRTYIGALPGQIIQMMRRAETVNPVFLLDEVDKLSSDFRGDPSAALMEVLDPEQNHAFRDHYLDVDYDLSRVFFIATANLIYPIPPALRDRMEIIPMAGYTDMEKLEIAKRHLVPKQLKAHGLKRFKIQFTDDALKRLIERYTREAGVRNLEREISSIMRKIAKEIVTNKRKKIQIVVDPDKVEQYLGKPRYRHRQKEKEETEIGVAMGLAWTEFGGEILATEATRMKGKGKLILTGKLGEVMQESAKAAMSYIRSHAEDFGIDVDFYKKYDIHIHVPEGAIPKDGPSAGITMATALVSLLTANPVRMDIAMSGEITLRGKVLPVGGIKDKVLAAFRAGIGKVILPKENEKDLDEIPEEVKKQMTLVWVEHIHEVLCHVLTKPLPFMQTKTSQEMTYPKSDSLYS